MTVEEVWGVSGGDVDRFTVGMRVLAVDDDPTCLRLLEGLLRKCQYQVTATSQARTALKMLRENKSRFDLVISDVHMPDMDGFKLLELVGLEMDLPVIMLSGNSDPKLVMKGVTHGACDYLVKPVRLEELRNIWQHVFRRKKFDKSSKKSTTDNQNEGQEGGQESSDAEPNWKLNRKRKDDEEEGEDYGRENEDPATQKKPRVVWSIDLHRKFVAAVNQLGLEKAVPKRILDLMNVEGLTRENVASHLQKYRLYLKRISLQQANMVSALGTKDVSYTMSSFEGIGDYRTFSGSGRLPNSSLSLYPSPAMVLNRLSSASGTSLRGLASSSLIQPNHGQNLNNSITALGKYEPVILSSVSNQNANLFSSISSLGEGKVLAASSGYADLRAAVCSPTSSLTSAQGNSLMLQGNPQSGGGLVNQTSYKSTTLNSEPFNVTSYGPSPLSASVLPSMLLPTEKANGQLPSNGMQSSYHPMSEKVQSNTGFSTTTALGPLDSSRNEFQGGLVGNTVQNTSHPINQKHGQYKQNNAQFATNAFSALATHANGGGVPALLQPRERDKSNVELKSRSDKEQILDQAKSLSGFVTNGYDPSDEFNSAMIKWVQDGMDTEFPYDPYNFRSCIDQS